jgi:hypothetical protein
MVGTSWLGAKVLLIDAPGNQSQARITAWDYRVSSSPGHLWHLTTQHLPVKNSLDWDS